MFITGGTGFLGRHLALALRNDHEVILGARNQKQGMAARQQTGCEVLPLDVTNIESIRDAFTESRPNVVIHAAATKFVDLAERQPMECIDINVGGSQNVARVAIDKGVSSVLGISTDKAAPPIRNTYGLSKAVMERIFCSMNGKADTLFACVRYGNVAWSTGSVLPLWKKMFDADRKIQSTGPQMSRFFFTVIEAVGLIETALDKMDFIQGKVLSREMRGATISRILDLWTSRLGGSWEAVEGRPGDRLEEFLIGESELEFTNVLEIDGVRHYLISPNERAAEPLDAPVSSTNSIQMTDDEIVLLISNTPQGELL